MLRVWRTETEASGVALRLSGRIGGEWACELERLCEDLFAQGKCITLDLADVGFIDEQGVGIIRLVTSRGATVTRMSPFVAARLQEKPGMDAASRFKRVTRRRGVDS